MTKAYNADEVTLMIGNDVIESGYADGEFVLIEEASPRIVKVVGTDGEVTVSKHFDRTATVTIKLFHTSDGNDVLDGMAALNVKGKPGLQGVKPLYIRDRQGRSIHEAAHCWVEEMPSASYDRTATAREWKLGVAQLTNTIKGNNNLGG